MQYVGQAFNLRTRIYRHHFELSKRRHGSQYLQHAFAKYGAEAFSYFILERLERGAGLKDALMEREQYWIDQWPANLLYNAVPKAGWTALGVKRSDATRARLSASLRRLGRKPTPEQFAKARATIASWTPEEAAAVFARRSIGHKGRFPTAEARAKMSAAQARRETKYHSSESRAKMSEAHRAHNLTPETRARMSAAAKARKDRKPASQETREKISLANRGKKRAAAVVAAARERVIARVQPQSKGTGRFVSKAPTPTKQMALWPEDK